MLPVSTPTLIPLPPPKIQVPASAPVMGHEEAYRRLEQSASVPYRLSESTAMAISSPGITPDIISNPTCR